MDTNVKQFNGIFYNSYMVAFYEDDTKDASIVSNTNYGLFTKEELFWAIYEKVLIPSGLYSYDCSPYEDKIHLNHIIDYLEDDCVALMLEIVGIDEGYSRLEDIKNHTLDETIMQFYNVLKRVCKDLGEEYIVKLELNKPTNIPKTEEDIIKRLKIQQYNC